MRGLAFFCFLLAALYAASGMGIAIYMTLTGDPSFAQLHSQLNLTGWLSMAVFGLYYHTVPEAAASRLAKLHVAAATLGMVLRITGVVMAHAGMTQNLTKIGSMIGMGAVFLFVIVVALSFRKAEKAV